MSLPSTDRRHPRGPVLASLGGGVVAVALAAVVAGLTLGAPQARGVVIAGVLVAVFFGVGLMLMRVALTFPPRLAFVLALMTYVLQLALVTLAFFVMDRSGVLGDEVDSTWLTLTAAVLCIAVIGTLMWWARTVRIPVYDLDEASYGTPAAGREVGNVADPVGEVPPGGEASAR